MRYNLLSFLMLLVAFILHDCIAAESLEDPDYSILETQILRSREMDKSHMEPEFSIHSSNSYGSGKMYSRVEMEIIASIFCDSDQEQEQQLHEPFDYVVHDEDTDDAKKEVFETDNESLEQIYFATRSQLQAWAEDFDAEAISQVKESMNITDYLINQQIVQIIFSSLDACSYGWLRNILVFTNYCNAPSIYVFCAANNKGFWGPVLRVELASVAITSCTHEAYGKAMAMMIIANVYESYLKNYSFSSVGPLLSFIVTHEYENLKDNYKARITS
jgi:hypothetical protein